MGMLQAGSVCLRLPNYLLFLQPGLLSEKGFMTSTLSGWPSHVKPDPMLTFIAQVNLWLPRDMEGIGGLVVGRYPGVNGFGGLMCAQPLRGFLQARWKGLEAPQAPGRMICTRLCLEDAEWHMAALFVVKAELQLKCFHAVQAVRSTSMPGAVSTPQLLVGNQRM